MRSLIKYLLVIAIPCIAYLLGPNPSNPVYKATLPALPSDAAQLEKYIGQKEGQHKVKPGNHARIIWANDSLKNQTEYAIVYLHGFSASQEDGNPVHTNIARKFGCNLYLARLAEHGINTSEQLLNLTATKYWESAKEAYAIGKKLGKNVIIMGTSTGASNALHLSSVYPDISGLILFSPNIAINHPLAWTANKPWGLHAYRLYSGSGYITPPDTTAVYAKYWNTPYRLEAVAELQEYLETTMTSKNFEKITQPTLMVYYYKNEVSKDSVVKIEAMQLMFDELNSSPSEKKSIALPKVGTHALACGLKSKDINGVEETVTNFFTNTLKLQPVQ